MMKPLWKMTVSWAAMVCLAIAAMGLAGCQTTNEEGFKPVPASAGPSGQSSLAGHVIQIADTVRVIYGEIDPAPPDHIETVKEDGTITLPYIGAVVAKGKTAGDLQKEIHDLYVPKIYRAVTITVIPGDQFVYVGGEVRTPGRFPYVGDMTVLKAIQTAGDFTDFAKKGNVSLTHANGETVHINCRDAIKKPWLDKPVFPGDKIYVPRRLL